MIHIYTDGSGHPKSGFGWFVKETNKSHYTRLDDPVTNNQAEYMAIISALQYVVHDLLDSGVFSNDDDVHNDDVHNNDGNDHNDRSDHNDGNDDNSSSSNNIVICSDSLNTVKQLNHQYAINNTILRELAMQAWSEMAKLNKKCKLEIVWIKRQDNLAGKMLGS